MRASCTNLRTRFDPPRARLKVRLTVPKLTFDPCSKCASSNVRFQFVCRYGAAANTALRYPELSVQLWREALEHAPFVGLGLHPEEFRSVGEDNTGGSDWGRRMSMDGGGGGGSSRSGCGGHPSAGGTEEVPDRQVAARDMPVLVACRAYAAQALWCSGAHVESVLMAEQVCGQLTALQSPMHCLLPSAVLAVGETVARACHVGMLQKKSGRRMLADCDQFLRVRAPALLPFASALAARLADVAPAGFL